FPMWLAPEQIRVLPLSDKSNDYARRVMRELADAGLRATMDDRDGKVQAKIRDAQLDLIPYMAVVGPKEAESDSLALRCRIDGEQGVIPITQAIEKLKKEADDRVVRQAVKNDFSLTDG
ncbi:MAG: His/Gly/Thr/Pro-type tRNA ligase C-terminal domain-containing protein, partial [Planctomycetota bacterium]